MLLYSNQIMNNICFVCGKGTVMGRSHTHHRGVAGGRWKKRAVKTQRAFKPNLQRVSVILEDVKLSVKMCTKCIKRVKKDVSEDKKPIVMLAHVKAPVTKTPEPIQA